MRVDAPCVWHPIASTDRPARGRMFGRFASRENEI